jgi:hypothetical protein
VIAQSAPRKPQPAQRATASSIGGAYPPPRNSDEAQFQIWRQLNAIRRSIVFFVVITLVAIVAGLILGIVAVTKSSNHSTAASATTSIGY